MISIGATTLHRHVTMAGVLYLAVPAVLIGALGGGIAVFLFRRLRPSRPAAASGLAALYLALAFFPSDLLARLPIRDEGESLAFASLVLGAWFVGGLAMIPAGLIIRKAAVRFAKGDAA
ncbi:MAG TPA: hypothetical protein VMR54_13140 [Thermoanaerobaculia bacterium]|nr:hypothetical protein [Thermoanaerobaculia bacterium]